MSKKIKTVITSDYAEQIRQLKHLAKQALGNYDLKIVGIIFLSHEENTVFKVIAENNNSKTLANTNLKYGVYLLRVYRQNRYKSITICSELAWLSFLSKNSNLEISEPVLNRDDSFLTIATTPETLEPRYCVLFKWLSGRFIKTRLTSKATKQVGTFLGYLHNHSQQFQPPKNFHRPKWDENGLLEYSPIKLPKENDFFSPSSKRILSLAAMKIRESLITIDKNSESFGLIHNDLHLGNCVFDRSRIKVFDFDDCGWGYYLYDLAIFLYYLASQENFASLQTSLFEGYLSVRSLPKKSESYLEAMIAARRLYLTRYLFQRQDKLEFKKTFPKFVSCTIEQMNWFIQRSA